MKTKLSVRDMCEVALCAALIAICAWISIPMPEVPFTLQTFGVFAALCLLGGKKGTLSILVYLLLGAVGLPVFAGFKGGIGALMGVTGGYLIGFLFSGLCYWGVTALCKKETLPVTVIALIVGNLICYLFGSIWFRQLYVSDSGKMAMAVVFAKCVIPYLLPDAVKLAAAVAIGSAVKKALRK